MDFPYYIKYLDVRWVIIGAAIITIPAMRLPHQGKAPPNTIQTAAIRTPLNERNDIDDSISKKYIARHTIAKAA